MVTAGQIKAPQGFSLGPCIGGLAGRTLVFAGTDSGGLPCALKTLDTAAAGAALVVARFNSECALHARANGCANVLPVHSGPAVAGWLITAWAHGGDLAAWLQRGGQPEQMRRATTMRIVVALLTACSELHARDIVHRDIKPSNVLLDGENVWLADFGLAASRNNEGEWRALPEPWVETEIGSPDWAAPELVSRTPHTHPANDVYGVGRVWQALALHAGSEPAHFVATRESMLRADYAARPTAAELLGWLRG